MSLANQSLINSLGITGFWLTDDDIALPNINVQAGAWPIKGEVSRVTKAAANNALILKSVLSGDASPLTFIINDSGSTINVFPAVGEQMNGVANAASSNIPTGQSLVCVRVPNNIGGSSSGWRSAVIP